MALSKIIQQGDAPVWEFKCLLCGQQWSERWTEDSDLYVYEVNASRSERIRKKKFQANMYCRCCGLLVWSNKIDGKDGNEYE